MGNSNNGGGTMMLMACGGIICCCIMSSAGLGGAYYFNDSFKKWVDGLFGKETPVKLSWGCPRGSVWWSKTPGKECYDKTAQKYSSSLSSVRPDTVNGGNIGCAWNKTWGTDANKDKCCSPGNVACVAPTLAS